MSDNGVREIHGGTMAAGMQSDPIILFEHDDMVVVQQDGISRFKLAPHNLRFLARKLNRLALRIEKRLAAKPGSAVVALPTAARK